MKRQLSLRRLAMASGPALVLLAGLVPGAAAAQTPVMTDAERAEARAILDTLVAFRSAAGQGQLHATADYIVATARAAGISEADIVRLPAGDSEGVIVRITGRDTAAAPVIFSAHFDVVDARPEDWEQDPFRVVEQDGFLVGRGVSDNKTGVTALLLAITRLGREHFRPSRTLLLTFVGDEESDQATTEVIASHPWLAGAAYAINTDAGGGLMTEDGVPRIYFVSGAEKTYASFRLTVRNPGGHSSVPRPDNAIYDLSRALLAIEGHRFPVMANSLTRDFLGTVGRVEQGPVADALRAFAANPADEGALAVLRADPEWANKIATTCVATMLDAGHAENALPQRATATVNCRIFPGTPIADVQAELAAAVANPAVQFETMGRPVETPPSELTGDVRDAITRVVHARFPGVPIAPSIMAGATDGLVYRAHGIPTFGSAGFFEVAGEGNEHGLNERIRTDSFYAGALHIYDLARLIGG